MKMSATKQAEHLLKTCKFEDLQFLDEAAILVVAVHFLMKNTAKLWLMQPWPEKKGASVDII